jgi:hypothetical protein
LLVARKESEADKEWGREFDLTGLAEHIAAARQCREYGAAHSVDRSPIYIPPGKEGTVRGRLAARINAARARIASFEAEVNPQR